MVKKTAKPPLYPLIETSTKVALASPVIASPLQTGEAISYFSRDSPSTGGGLKMASGFFRGPLTVKDRYLYLYHLYGVCGVNLW